MCIFTYDDSSQVVNALRIFKIFASLCAINWLSNLRGKEEMMEMACEGSQLVDWITVLFSYW